MAAKEPRHQLASQRDHTLVGHNAQLVENNLIDGTEVRAARALIGWTQELLASRAGVARNSLADFEDGVRMPRKRVRDAIIGALESEGVRFVALGDGRGMIRLPKNEQGTGSVDQ